MRCSARHIEASPPVDSRLHNTHTRARAQGGSPIMSYTVHSRQGAGELTEERKWNFERISFRLRSPSAMLLAGCY
jgi:hypothetical protein